MKKTNKDALHSFKMEVANELGVDLKQGGHLTSAEAGRVGGEMVKQMIAKAKNQMR